LATSQGLRKVCSVVASEFQQLTMPSDKSEK